MYLVVPSVNADTRQQEMDSIAIGAGRCQKVCGPWRARQREPIRGSGGGAPAAPGGGSGGRSPPEAEAFLAFWTSNGYNKFAPFAVFLVCSRIEQAAIEQVAQLSLANPRDLMHHDKRQNLKPVT